MRAQPTPQERPKAFHRVDVHFAQAVAIVIAGKLASPVVDTLMAVALIGFQGLRLPCCPRSATYV